MLVISSKRSSITRTCEWRLVALANVHHHRNQNAWFYMTNHPKKIRLSLKKKKNMEKFSCIWIYSWSLKKGTTQQPASIYCDHISYLSERVQTIQGFQERFPNTAEQQTKITVSKSDPRGFETCDSLGYCCNYHMILLLIHSKSSWVFSLEKVNTNCRNCFTLHIKNPTICSGHRSKHDKTTEALVATSPVWPPPSPPKFQPFGQKRVVFSKFLPDSKA